MWNIQTPSFLLAIFFVNSVFLLYYPLPRLLCLVLEEGRVEWFPYVTVFFFSSSSFLEIVARRSSPMLIGRSMKRGEGFFPSFSLHHLDQLSSCLDQDFCESLTLLRNKLSLGLLLGHRCIFCAFNDSSDISLTPIIVFLLF